MKNLSLATLLLLSFSAFSQKTIYDFSLRNIDGKPVSLAEYKGKVVLIVNVASRCGFTKQYADLQQLFEKYEAKGVVILGFPANNFMGQEPGSDVEIKKFCSTKFNVKFPMFSKISVKGDDMAPLYKFLTSKAQNGVADSKVKWNFQKYLINKKGQLVTSFDSSTNPTDAEITTAIEKGLK